MRVVYFYHTGNLVIGLHAFVKKSQQTPRQELAQAWRVQRRIEDGDHNEEE